MGTTINEVLVCFPIMISKKQNKLQLQGKECFGVQIKWQKLRRGSNCRDIHWNPTVATKASPVLALLVSAPGPWPLLSIVSHLSGKRQNWVTSRRKQHQLKAPEAKTMRRAAVQQRGRRAYLPQHFQNREDEVGTWGNSTHALVIANRDLKKTEVRSLLYDIQTNRNSGVNPWAWDRLCLLHKKYIL